MPELPEVETVVRQLAPHIEGERLRELRVFDPKLASTSFQQCHGKRVESVTRHGKQIVISLVEKSEKSFLIIHLRMTGVLLWSETRSQVGSLVRKEAFSEDEKYLRATLCFEKGVVNFFDVRRFGTIKWCASLPSNGVEPLSPDFQKHTLLELLRGSRQPMKQWLLRQDRVVGIGNIYACEILFDAKIAPEREAGALSEAEAERVVKATKKILQRAIALSGTTFSDFKDTTGSYGGFQDLLKVYDREGELCRKCRTEIRRVVQVGRSTFFCPECQNSRAHSPLCSSGTSQLKRVKKKPTSGRKQRKSGA